MNQTSQKRIQILAPDEINEIYKLPVLNHGEREEYFALDDNIIDTVRKLDKFETKLYFILGYCA